MANFVRANVDDLPIGTMVYSLDRVPLGMIKQYYVMNGDRPPIPERHIDAGKKERKHQLRNRYLIAQASGVLIRETGQDQPSK